MTADRPWQRSDWLDQSKAWLEQQLRQSGATACAYREVHSNDRARVVKVKTSLGDVFLKAGEEPLEGLILHRLAVEAPGIGPRLFASHARDKAWQSCTCRTHCCSLVSPYMFWIRNGCDRTSNFWSGGTS